MEPQSKLKRDRIKTWIYATITHKHLERGEEIPTLMYFEENPKIEQTGAWNPNKNDLLYGFESTRYKEILVR